VTSFPRANRSRTGALIGKGGEELNIIRKQTGGIIKLSQNKAYYPGTDERVVLIKGRPDSAFSLLKLVHSKIRTRKAPPIINGRPFNEIRLQQMKLIIANSTAGKIIGTGGEIIKFIQTEHNVKLFITNVDNPKEKRIQNERICTIKGDELSVNKCMIDLVERIASDEMADLDTNIDYPKCEDNEIMLGFERPVFFPGIQMQGLGGLMGMQGMQGMQGMPGGERLPTYDDLVVLQEQTKALQAMTNMTNVANMGGGLMGVNPMGGMVAMNGMGGAMNGMNGLSGMGGGVPAGLALHPGYRQQMMLAQQKPEYELLTPEMAMLYKQNEAVQQMEQMQDPYMRQFNPNLQALLLQRQCEMAKHSETDHGMKVAQQAAQYAVAQQQGLMNGSVGMDQYGNLTAGATPQLPKRFPNTVGNPTSHHSTATPQPPAPDASSLLLNRAASGLTTSAMYQSPLVSHVAQPSPLSQMQAAQSLQQSLQLQALQQSQQQSLQDAHLQHALQAFHANQLQTNALQAQAQLQAQVMAQHALNGPSTSTKDRSKRFHPYSAPPPPPPATPYVAPVCSQPPTEAALPAIATTVTAEPTIVSEVAAAAH